MKYVWDNVKYVKLVMSGTMSYMLNVLYLGKCQNAKSVMSGTMTNILNCFFLGRCQICGFWNSRAYDPVFSGQIIRFIGRILYSGLIQKCKNSK